MTHVSHEPVNEPVRSAYQDARPAYRDAFKRVVWGAIFAGIIVTVVLQLLFTLLGVGIGAATVEPLQQAHPGRGLGVGAAIWFFVSTLISIYVGARLAGYLSGNARKEDRELHGILTWAGTTILSVLFLATTAGALLGGGASLLGGAAATAGRGQPAYATGSTTAYAQTSPPGNFSQSPSTTTREPALSPTGRAPLDQPALSDDQAARQAQAELKAREAGDVAAKRVSQASLWTFFVLLISGFVAMFACRADAAPGARRHSYAVANE